MSNRGQSSTYASAKEVLDFTCKTKVNTSKCRFKWVIENFSLFQHKFGEKFTSSSFHTRSSSTTFWNLSLYPNGDTRKSEGYLSLFISPSFPGVTAKFKFSILKGPEEKREYAQTAVKFFADTNGFGYSHFVRRSILFDERFGLLQKDTLTILCELETAEVPFISREEPQRNSVKLVQDLEMLYKTSKLADVILSTTDKDFNAHKAILSARSPVFAAMFEHEMEESKSNLVRIVDADSRIMEEILYFMYTGECLQMEDLAAEVLPLAEKYNIEDLKAMCEDTLASQLSAENAVTTFILADIHNSRRLKEKTINFILSLGKVIVESPAWKSLASTHPNLAVQLYTAAIDRNVVVHHNT